MSISFKELVESVLIPEAYADSNAAFADINGWLNKVQESFNTDIKPRWDTLYASTMGGKNNFAKKDIQQYFIAVQDLIRSLAFHKDIKAPGAAILEKKAFIDKVQEEYKKNGSNVRVFIDSWCSKEHDPNEGYKFTDPQVERYWNLYKKEQDVIAAAAFTQYKGSCIFPAIMQVIDYKSKNNQGVLSGKFPASASTFQGLVLDAFKSINDYVIGAKKQKGLSWSIADTFKTLASRLFATSSVKQFEEKVEDTRFTQILKFAISSRALFDALLLEAVVKSGGGLRGKLIDFYIVSSNTTNKDGGSSPVQDPGGTSEAFIRFVRDGKIDGVTVMIISEEDSAKHNERVEILSTDKFVLSRIEALNTDQSRDVINQFKDLCSFVNSGESKMWSNVTSIADNAAGAAGAKLYG
jgi:hypothetical protein